VEFSLLASLPVSVMPILPIVILALCFLDLTADVEATTAFQSICLLCRKGRRLDSCSGVRILG
jgi:hypothetical protein